LHRRSNGRWTAWDGVRAPAEIPAQNTSANLPPLAFRTSPLLISSPTHPLKQVRQAPKGRDAEFLLATRLPL